MPDVETDGNMCMVRRVECGWMAMSIESIEAATCTGGRSDEGVVAGNQGSTSVAEVGAEVLISKASNGNESYRGARDNEDAG
jgi:hypothetical protein